MHDPYSTIAAVSTPPAPSIMGIVRLSGPDAFRIVSRLSGMSLRRLRAAPPYSCFVGKARCKGVPGRTDCVFLTMKAPSSYTREDVAEVHTWGMPYLLGKILEACVSFGARIAIQGEFTKRAFLNGRIDLAQAEAVLSLINSGDDSSRRASLSALKGEFKEGLASLRSSVMECLALIETAIDFSSEDIIVAEEGDLLRELECIRKAAMALAEGERRHAISSERPNVVILGPPNSGKSSLFNRLSIDARNIVSPMAGTTRDAIKASASVKGVFYSIYDTAGLRRALTGLERAGIDRAIAAAGIADLFIVVLDGSARGSSRIKMLRPFVKGRPAIIALNKSDLPLVADMVSIRKSFPTAAVMRVSALTGSGMAGLNLEIRAFFSRSPEVRGPGLTVSARHAEALRKATAHIAKAKVSLKDGFEFAADELRSAVEELRSIDGFAADAGVLDLIFSRFCIGK